MEVIIADKQNCQGRALHDPQANGWTPQIGATPLKFNVAPENRAIPKGNSSSNHHFSGSMLNFRGAM